MDAAVITTGLTDVSWIAIAFLLGLLARLLKLPPLVGFLLAGFLLSTQDNVDSDVFEKLADLGITLLLFTIGLKLSLRTLARPQVWAVSAIHMSATIAVFVVLLHLLVFLGVFAELELRQAMLIAFALSFSSTVFVVKVLEDRGSVGSLHGRIAVGILLMQDIAAVVFLAASTGHFPSLWALLLLLLIPCRRLLHGVMDHIGHGELLVLYGLVLSLGGAGLFEAFGVKGDLGALIIGVLMASHSRASEMAKVLFSFKDLFLLGFFVSIGLSGDVSVDNVLIGLALAPMILFKTGLFFFLLTGFGLRARSSVFASINLGNYSEFGLIVAAIGAQAGWIDLSWLLSISIGMAISFVLAAVFSSLSEDIYERYRDFLRRFQRERIIGDDRLLDLGGATIAVIGMGRVGAGTYDLMLEKHGETVVGIDSDPVMSREQRARGRQVLTGDPSDKDFWDRVQATHTLKLVMLALPRVTTNLDVLEQLKQAGFSGHVAATARYPEEMALLTEAGATTVYNLYTEAGSGFATHVHDAIPGLVSRS
ncbi:MAG: cation:proton antiporter family protein [Pseudomonadota bacterium]